MSTTIIHNKYNLKTGFLHSITVDGKEGKRVGNSIIARNGVYAATTVYYCCTLPALFTVTTIPVLSYKTESFDVIPDTRYPYVKRDV